MACNFVPLKAQFNLVPNPSFEDVISCPNGLGQIYLAAPWTNYRFSPDIYCECSPSGVGVPQNNLGYQFPISGNCMAGVVTFRKQASPAGPNAREYIGIELYQPLTIGNEYFFSSYINCSGGPSVIVGANKFGMKLLTYEIDSTAGVALITNSAVIFSDSILTDTLNWFKISGSFIADSAYTHLVLGNFFDDLNTDTASFKPGTPDYTYYYVDGICLSSDSAYCENWTFSNQIKEDNVQTLVFPNPVNSILHINSSKIFKNVSVLSILDTELIQIINVDKANIELDIRHFRPGVYLLVIDYGNYQHFKKILKL